MTGEDEDRKLAEELQRQLDVEDNERAEADRKLAEEIQRQLDAEGGAARPASAAGAGDERLAKELQEKINLEMEFEAATQQVDAGRAAKGVAARIQREVDFEEKGKGDILRARHSGGDGSKARAKEVAADFTNLDD
mmetsp:Transcript_29718/g.95528  ORF Transcript_29718/g.95528 Transcript_29718/m.95528 type:complete len:136 (+) Transcript_29718:135-542(+)